MSGGAQRVLYVESNVDGTVGGSYYSLFYLVSGVDRRRFEPLVVFHADNWLRQRFHACGVRTIVLSLREAVTLRGLLGKALSKCANFVRGWVCEPIRLAAFLRRERIALVHLNNSIVKNHSWMVAAILARVPCVTHERGLNTHFAVRARWLARRLDGIICISAIVRDNLIARGFESENLFMIYNGLDPAEMHATRSRAEVRGEIGLHHASHVVGIVGNIKQWKGQEVVVRAIALVRDRHPEVGCVLIGDSSPDDLSYRLKLEQLIHELGLRGRVVITGNRRDVANYINALDIQVHASISPEPFGRVLLEAMALAKPIVASDAGAVPEIVLHGSTGLVFESGSPPALAECIERLLNDPVYAKELGENGYLRLVRDFSVGENVRKTEFLYDSLLSRRQETPKRA